MLPNLEKVLADGDLDGLIAAAVLRTVYPHVEVRFGHPAEVRGGHHDDWIDRRTAICDLPFHLGCGLYLDHHLTNRPDDATRTIFEAAGGVSVWEDKPSAARVAYDLFQESCDLSHLAPLMPMVDALDSGGISREDFLSDDPVVWLSRTISLSAPDYVHKLLDWLCSGWKLEKIMAAAEVQQRVAMKKAETERMRSMLSQVGEVKDRLAVVRLEDTGLRTNGYLVTAHFGERCDACLIVHGWVDGDIADHSRPALGASFYCNSFLHGSDGVMDLTHLATLFDETGGGHANACGCRVKPLQDSGDLVDRPVEIADIQRNLDGWLALWAQR